MSKWLLLVTNLPGANQALRMRLWRGLKSVGATSLRDGVYLLPHGKRQLAEFGLKSAEITQAGGSTWLLPCNATAEQDRMFRASFDRAADYAELLSGLRMFRRGLSDLDESSARRELGRLQQRCDQVRQSDFFPGPALQQAEAAMRDAQEALSRRFLRGEPRAVRRTIPRLRGDEFVARTWATRRHIWIDRICSAWLITRFIDPEARFVWLKQVRKLPEGTVGFDFDGARFTHVGAKVTFEVLLHSFGLERDKALQSLGAAVHFLDVGGDEVPEAAGLAAVAAGARTLAKHDDELLKMMAPVLDSLYVSFGGSGSFNQEKSSSRRG